MAKDWAKPFYASTAWRRQRVAALKRDAFTCQRCGFRANEVHHKIELTEKNITDPGVTLALSNLESLCRDCHAQETLRGTEIADGYFFDDHGQPTPLGGAKKWGDAVTEGRSRQNTREKNHMTPR
jgi:5-methylcytosine-specific restriction protein A